MTVYPATLDLSGRLHGSGWAGRNFLSLIHFQIGFNLFLSMEGIEMKKLFVLFFPDPFVNLPAAGNMLAQAKDQMNTKIKGGKTMEIKAHRLIMKI